MIALSPTASWLLIGIVLGFAVVVYITIAGGHRYRRMEEQAEAWSTYTETWTYPAKPYIRITGGVYDHEAHGDFE